MKDHAMGKGVGYLPGISQPRLLDKLAGRHDAATGQLRPVGEGQGVSTPWILRKTEHLLAYAGKHCLALLDRDAPLYQKIARDLTELDQLRGAVPGDARSAHAGAGRQLQLALDLSRAQAVLRTHDEALAYRLETARKKYRAHVAAYWSGILVRSKTAPLEPGLDPELRSPAYESYRTQWKQVMARLDEALAGKEEEDRA